MKDYFDLQLVMTNRKIEEAGLNPVLVCLLGLILFVVLSEYIFHKTEFAKYLIILVCFSFQFKLSENRRTDFLLSTFGDKSKNKIRIGYLSPDFREHPVSSFLNQLLHHHDKNNFEIFLYSNNEGKPDLVTATFKKKHAIGEMFLKKVIKN